MRPVVSMPRSASWSSSAKKVSGSSTTPLPTTQVTPPCRMPDGIWRRMKCESPMTTVWPAFAPP